MRTAAAALLVLLAAGAQAAITGTLADLSGKPLPHVRVAAYAFEPDDVAAGRTIAGELRPVLAETESADDGSFGLTVNGPHDVLLAVEADGFIPYAAVHATGEAAGTIVLLRAEMQDVLITDGKEPVPGALVAAWGANGARWERRSNSKGILQIPEPERWVIRALVAHRDHLLWRGVPSDVVTLSSGISVKGKVIDSGGNGVGGAQLFVDEMPYGKTRDDGSFTLQHLSPSWEKILVRHGDEYGVGSRHGSFASISLQHGARVSGWVRDSEGRPVVGAIVRVYNTEWGITDASGRYSIHAAVPAKETIALDPTGTLASDSAPVTLKAGQSVERNFVAKPRPLVSGIVKTAAGAPAAGAVVSAPDSPNEWGETPSRFTTIDRRTITGADGRFRLRCNPDEDEISLRAVGLGTTSAEAGSIKLPVTKEVVLTLPAGVEVRGRVVDEAGQPVAGASVTPTFAEATSAPVVSEPFRWAITDSAGEFHGLIEAGRHGLLVTHRGHLENRSMFKVAAPMKPLTVRLDQAFRLAGRVVNGKGVPLAHVMVGIVGLSDYAETDGNGVFTLQVPKGTWAVGYGRAGLEGTKSVTAPASGIELVIPAGATIHGRALDRETGEPLREFEVAYATKDALAPDSTPVSSSDGSYSVEDVPVGDVTVIVSADDYLGEEVEVHVTEAGAEVPTVSLRRSRRVHGTVTGPDGKPLEAVWISTGPHYHSHGNGTGAIAMSTDAAGNYELEGLGADEESIEFRLDGFLSEHRTLPPSAGNSSVLNVRMATGLTLRGRVVDDEGKGVAGASLEASSVEVGADSQAATSDDTGAFTIGGLASARYDLEVRAGDTGDRRGKVSDIDVAKTPEVTVRLTKPATGSVSGTLSGGDPSAPRTVWIEGSMSYLQADVDEEGRFEIKEVPSGAAKVGGEFNSSKSRVRTPPVTIDVQPGKETHVELAFQPTASVHGRVTRGGEPVAGAVLNFTTDEDSSQAATGEQGAYEVKALTVGKYEVTISAPGERAEVTLHCTVAAPSSNCDFDLFQQQARVTVTDSGTGQPIADVQISGESAASPGQPDGFGATDAAGVLVFKTSPGQALELTAQHEGYATARAMMKDPATPIAMTLTPSDGAVVRIVDARDGRTLTGYAAARDATGKQVATNSDPDSDGTFRLAVLPGRYRFSASATGYGSATVSASTGAEVVVPLRREGTLVIHSSAPLAGTARLIEPDGSEYVRCWCNGIAEIPLTGRVTTVDAVAPGAYTLVIESGGTKRSMAVTVVEGQTTTVDL